MTAPDDLVWVAAVRRGITYHRIAPLYTGCGRSMRRGFQVSLTRAARELAGERCPRCWTAAEPTEGFGPADGTADAGSGPCSGAAPAPSPVPASAGDGVTPVNDRLYDELLKPVVDRFYAVAQSLAALPAGDLIAGVLMVASPDWEFMSETALDAPAPDGTAVSSPAAVPPQIPARVAVTNSDSGCPGGHHNLPGDPA